MIEPQEEMEPSLSQLSAKMPICNYVKTGVGKEEGELIQTIWDDLVGSSFLPEPDIKQLRADRQRKTKVTTVDILLFGPLSLSG